MSCLFADDIAVHKFAARPDKHNVIAARVQNGLLRPVGLSHSPFEQNALDGTLEVALWYADGDAGTFRLGRKSPVTALDMGTGNPAAFSEKGRNAAFAA